MNTTLTTLIAAEHRKDLYAQAARGRQARLARQARAERPEPAASAELGLQRRPLRLRALRIVGHH